MFVKGSLSEPKVAANYDDFFRVLRMAENTPESIQVVLRGKPKAI